MDKLPQQPALCRALMCSSALRGIVFFPISFAMHALELLWYYLCTSGRSQLACDQLL